MHAILLAVTRANTSGINLWVIGRRRESGQTQIMRFFWLIRLVGADSSPVPYEKPAS